MKWFVVFAGILVFGAVAMTGFDKYDERSCRENPAIVGSRTEQNPHYVPELGDSIGNRRFQTVPVYERCEGFLPW